MVRRRTPVLIDLLLAVVLTGLSAATIAERGVGPGGWPGVALAALAVAPVAVRQVAPLATTAVIALALVAYALLGYGEWPSNALGLVVAMFTVATVCSRAVAAVVFPAVVAVVLLALVTVDGVTWTMALQAALICAGAWALGDATQGWAREAEDAAQGAERSLAEERTRIARELHDVVSHHLSVVALQSGVAGYLLDADPAAARTALDHAREASREGLVEMRRMLEALRPPAAGTAPYDPQPGLREVPQLIERLHGAGLEVAYEVLGGARRLPPGVELCAYRVVQESLTNVVRHAAPASRAAVRIKYEDRLLEVEVSDDGAGVPGGVPGGVADVGADGGAPGPGNGLRGMRERAELYGGVLEAGPAPPAGFLVRLRLPIEQPAPVTPHASPQGSS